jgi:alkylated DNA nucleotide flippase Atl1
MVWNEQKKTPEGAVRTYKKIAFAIGKPNSARLLQMHVEKTLDQLKYHVTE